MQYQWSGMKMHRSRLATHNGLW